MPINTIQARQAQQNQQMNTPMACPDCGGTYFASLEAHQYANIGYGSAQFRQLTIGPVSVKVCIGCSRFIYPEPGGGAAAPGASPAFREAIKAGTEYRKKLALNANAVASKKELDDVASKVAGLLKAVNEDIPKDIDSVRQEALSFAQELGPIGISQSEDQADQSTPKTSGRKHARTQAPGKEHQ